ncbi:hypothetical protein LXA43DRAFT_1103722 [Ganoderma leucocontextum]|nr:hypothetical protein LXA43DRAFT_1103722 [Ganoderma leucocontextum]
MAVGAAVQCFVPTSPHRGKPLQPWVGYFQRHPAAASSNWWAGLVLTSPAGDDPTDGAGCMDKDRWLVPGLINGGSASGVDFWMEDGKLTYNGSEYEQVPDASCNFTDFEVSSGEVWSPSEQSC